MNFKVQRFQKGHPLFSQATITNTDEKRGVIGVFRPVFGQMADEKGDFICYTMERADTLIPNGVYEYDLYDSPHNKRIVPRLTKDEKGVNISARTLEVHPANWPYQLKGCTAPGLQIDKSMSSILSSRLAFDEIMKRIAKSNAVVGTITYEYLEVAA